MYSLGTHHPNTIDVVCFIERNLTCIFTCCKAKRIFVYFEYLGICEASYTERTTGSKSKRRKLLSWPPDILQAYLLKDLLEKMYHQIRLKWLFAAVSSYGEQPKVPETVNRRSLRMLHFFRGRKC